MAISGVVSGVTLLVCIGIFFRTLPPEQLVLGALTSSYRLPSSWFKTALSWRTFPPDYRTDGGTPLVQFALAAFDPEQPETNEKMREILNLLLARGAAINAASHLTGLRPLHDAVLYGSEDLVQFLLKKGANPQLKARAGKFEGLTPLEFAYALGNRGGADRRPIITLLEARTPGSH